MIPPESPAAVRLADLPATLYVLAFPYWKWPVVRQCFPGRRIEFIEKIDRLPADATLVVWGRRAVDGLPAGVRLLRMEDGFLRSVGLGADLVRPLSWIVDRQGIYYDATTPSELEELLATACFDDELRQRAARLRQRLVESGLTKYNVGARQWQRPPGVAQVILVPGQVESDASLRYGAPGERSNMGLLRAVRAAHPTAYILYKPHPDVVARLRIEGDGEAGAGQWCDEVLTDVAMGDLLREVDAVHVLTSLAGFEALLRGKAVTCHGQPFYAGWGLTEDHLPPARRTRRLSLDELVAGVLILYPLYMSRDGRSLCGPEQALDQLAAWRAVRGGREPWWRNFVRIFLRRLIGVR